MEATAKLMFARISTRKARMVLDMVRGQYVAEAIEQLRFTHKAAAPLVGKLLGSAISNAQRKNESSTKDRARAKALRTAVTDAEAEVHRLEARAAEVRAQLEDPVLYEDAEGVRRSTALKAELDDLDEALVLALEEWTNATEALARS